MPILFIVLGICLTCILFNVFLFKKFMDKFCLIVAICLIMFGYFTRGAFFLNFSFNVFFCLASLVVLIYLFSKVYFELGDLFFLVVTGLLYYLMLNKNLSYLIGYSNLISIFAVIVIVFLYSSKLYKSAFMGLMLSLILVVISGIFSFDNFGIIELDFLFVIEVMFFSTLFSVLKFLFSKVMSNMYLWRNYVKKVNCVYYANFYRCIF